MGKTPSSHIIHSLGGEYCWIVRDSEPIRLLKSPRSLSVYILKEIMSSLLRLELQQKWFLKIHFENAHFRFCLTHLELTADLKPLRSIRSYTPVVPSIPYPIPDQNGKSLYPSSDQNSAKPTPFGAAHTYMAYRREYPRKLSPLK